MKKFSVKEFRSEGSKEIAEHSKGFFKTGKGEYGEGDFFLGIRVPLVRKYAKNWKDITFVQTQKLIDSKFHEERLLGLIILNEKYAVAEKARDLKLQKEIYTFYVKNFKRINNWDLVDTTCPKVIGKYLMDKDRKVLYKWAKSRDLWTKRISMITCWWFIRSGDLEDTYQLAEIHLLDQHDLMHKAVGWMLREAGKKDEKRLEAFIRKHHGKMARTCLRYAIEKFPEKKRKALLAL